MIALEVSSAAKRPPYGGVTGTVRSLVEALLRIDPETRYALAYRPSRLARALRRRCLFRPAAPNAALRPLQDPWNGLLLREATLLHSMGIFLPRTPRIPKLVTVHDLNAVRNVEWVSEHWHTHRTARIRQAVERADHVVTYSQFTAAEVCEEFGLSRERVHPVHLGVDRVQYRPDPEGGRRMRKRYGDYVLAVGMEARRKNLPRLVEALEKLPELRLLLVGTPGDASRAVEEAAERCGIGKRLIRLGGRVSTRDMVALASGARVFAVPSLYEGFGLTVLEAMACGTPVVCSDAASLPEVAGNAALLVDARDPNELAEAIRRVHQDEILAAELRRQGLARSEAMSWEASARRLRALYARLGGDALPAGLDP